MREVFQAAAQHLANRLIAGDELLALHVRQEHPLGYTIKNSSKRLAGAPFLSVVPLTSASFKLRNTTPQSIQLLQQLPFGLPLLQHHAFSNPLMSGDCPTLHSCSDQPYNGVGLTEVSRHREHFILRHL
jgi:hypothetical protein